jgi:hypothetical protein
MAENRPSINLLPRKGEGFLSQFLNWAVNIGRLLIIITETVALATFLYRFNLDMKIVDLHDEIKQKSFIVKNFKTYEDSFRNLQERLALAKTYDEAGKKNLTIFTDITELGRGKVSFRNLLVSVDIIKIEAQAPSTAALSQFTNSLKTYPKIQSVSIDNVENSTANARITVSITAVVQGSKLNKSKANTLGSGSVGQGDQL